jgi:hypothetical protein
MADSKQKRKTSNGFFRYKMLANFRGKRRTTELSAWNEVLRSIQDVNQLELNRQLQAVEHARN